MSTVDQEPLYWESYGAIQKAKHDLIKEYLNGWFPKMTLGGTGVRKLLYIDTHAGRGVHKGGESGSPVVAVETLFRHTSRDDILRNTEVIMYFIERNEANATVLSQQLQPYRHVRNLELQVVCADAFSHLGDVHALFQAERTLWPASLLFVDPYGFKLPADLFRQFLSYPKVEMFVNVMWRWLYMSQRLALGVPCEDDVGPVAVIRKKVPSLFDLEEDDESEVADQDSDEDQKMDQAFSSRGAVQQEANQRLMDMVFGGNLWRQLVGDTNEDRADCCAELFRRVYGASWATHLRMRKKNQTRHFLLHLTNHREGRNLMKECCWKVSPGGGFYASDSHAPKQRILMEPEPELAPLHEWLCQRLSSGPRRWNLLKDDLDEVLWLGKHLAEVINAGIKRKVFELDEGDRLIQKRNQEVRLKQRQ